MRWISRTWTLVFSVTLLGCGEEPRAATPPPSSQAAVPAATVTDPFGYYFLEGAEELPEWAQAIDHLHLSNIDMQGETIVTVPLHGWIRMKEVAGGADYHLVEPRIDGLGFTFRTKEIAGASYAFEGEFQQGGEMPALVPEGVVLRGRLRRLSPPEPPAEIEARFFYTAGD